MRIHFTLIIVAVLGILAPPVRSQISDPFLVIVNNSDWSPDRRAAMNGLINEFLPDGADRFRTREQLISSSRGTPFDLNRREFVNGIARATLPDGKVVKYAFRTMPDQESFRTFIKKEIERRGESTRVAGTEFEVHLSNPPGVRDPSLPKHIPVISKTDCWWKWDDGVLIWSSAPFVFDVAAAPLHSHIRRGRGKDWYLYAEPDAVPRSIRNQYLRQFAAIVGVHMQKTDAEPDTAHAIRKAFGENAVELAESALMEIESIIASQAYPGAGSSDPYKGQLTINIRRNSNLAKLLSQFRSSRSMPAPMPGSVAQATANLAVPQAFRPGLKALVAHSRLAGSTLGNAIDWMIDEGVVRFSGACLLTEKDAVLTAVVDPVSTNLTTHDIANALGGSLNEAGVAVIPLTVSAFGDALASQSVGVRVSGNRLRGSLTVNNPQPALDFSEAEEEQVGLSSPLVFQASGDPSRISEEEDGGPGRQFIHLIVDCYQNWVTYQKSERYRIYRYGTKTPRVPVVPVIDTMKPDGDNQFKIRLSISPGGTTVHADASIGRDLYGWLLVRKMVTGMSLNGP